MDVRGNPAMIGVSARHGHWPNTVELVASILGAGPAEELLDRPRALQRDVHGLECNTGRQDNLVLNGGEAGNPTWRSAGRPLACHGLLMI
jgi:hypothetical protein